MKKDIRDCWSEARVVVCVRGTNHNQLADHLANMIQDFDTVDIVACSSNGIRPIFVPVVARDFEQEDDVRIRLRR